jgi:hypothetical protein
VDDRVMGGDGVEPSEDMDDDVMYSELRALERFPSMVLKGQSIGYEDWVQNAYR